MGRKNKENEMEQIRQGLEAFLDKEIDAGDGDGSPVETCVPQRDMPSESAWAQEEDFGMAGACGGIKAPNTRRCQKEDAGGRRKRTSGKGTSGKESSGIESPGKEPPRKKTSGKEPKKPRKKKRRFLKFLLVMALLAALAGAGLYQVVGVVYVKMNYKEVESMSALPMKEDGVVNILGNGVAVDCESLWTEMQDVIAKGVPITPENLKISDRASLLLPWHRELDSLEEQRLADKKYGSTKQGIAPFYSDK